MLGSGQIFRDEHTTEHEAVDTLRYSPTDESTLMDPQLSLSGVNNQLPGLAKIKRKIVCSASPLFSQIINLQPVF